MITVVAAASYLPWLALSLYIGVLVDRWDRVRLLRAALLTSAAATLALAGLVASGLAQLWVLVAVALVLGTAEVLIGNTFQSLLPELLAKDQLRQANSVQYTSSTVARSFVGPPLGSALYSVASSLPVVVGGLGAAAAAIGLRWVRVPQQPSEPMSSGGSVPSGVREGLKFLQRDRLLRLLAVLLGWNNLCNQIGAATLVILVTQAYQQPASVFGVAMAAMAAGSVLGGVVNRFLFERLGGLRLLIASLVVSALVSIGIGILQSFIWLCVMLFVFGLSSIQWNVLTVTLRQERVPRELFGRVNSIYRLISWGAIPIGAVLGGLLVSVVAVTWAFPVGGALRLIVLVVVVRSLIEALLQPRSANPGPEDFPGVA